jgi:hypothetical protein
MKEKEVSFSNFEAPASLRLFSKSVTANDFPIMACKFSKASATAQYRIPIIKFP